jgi:hypothetical protein
MNGAVVVCDCGHVPRIRIAPNGAPDLAVTNRPAPPESTRDRVDPDRVRERLRERQ